MTAPLVSVLLPVHNRAGRVARAVDSVLDQGHPGVELIAIDDGSTDETPAVLDGYGARLVRLRQSRRGAYAARNLGLRHARGDLVAFIDSDDRWLPGRLARQLPLLDDHDVGLVFGDAVLVDHRGLTPTRRPLTAFQITPPRRGWVARHFAYGNFVPMSAVLVRRRCLDDVDGFPETPPLSADYLAWYRISLRHRLDFVPAPVFEYAVSPDGLSRDLVASLRARIALFSALLRDGTEPRAADEVRRLLFHLHLSLALAGVRRGRRAALSGLADGWHGLRGSSRREGLRWSLEYVGNQLRVRLGRRRATRGPEGTG